MVQSYRQCLGKASLGGWYLRKEEERSKCLGTCGNSILCRGNNKFSGAYVADLRMGEASVAGETDWSQRRE